MGEITGQKIVGRKPPINRKLPAMPPVSQTTRLATRGQTSIIVTPPRPCGLGNCVAELHVTVRSDTTRIHLDDQQRHELIVGLGEPTELDHAQAEDLAFDRGYKAGYAFALNDPALPDANERAVQRGLGGAL